ncbi:MAG TPA: hypothetical protein VMB50_22655 [Myxococcales bacterium]|nr:hypothetical protein [Myxococcales bacterium]
MSLSRLSLFYLVSYLVGAGVGLLAAPRLVFVLLGSTQADAYGVIVPRMVGALALALGTFVIQIIRWKLTQFYPTLVAVRVFLVAVWAWLFALTRDPFFVVLGAIVAFGALLTAAGLVLDRRARPVADRARAA